MTTIYNEICKKVAEQICQSCVKTVDSVSTRQVQNVIKFTGKKFIINVDKINKQKPSKVVLTKNQQTFLFSSLINEDCYLPDSSICNCKP